MTLGELFRRLSYGPLSNLALSNNGDGTIIAEKQPMIVHFTNEGLLRLYSRFILSEKEVIIEQREDTTSYTLSSEYAYSNLDTDPTTTVLIQDSEEDPFQDDVLKILAVYDTEGCALPLNDLNHCDSVFTPQPDVLQVPTPVEGLPLHILYQAMHPKLVDDPIDVAAEITLPVVLEEALLAYIAHKVFNYMNGQEHTVKSADHLGVYEMVCAEVVERDLINSSISQTSSKFKQRGFK